MAIGCLIAGLALLGSVGQALAQTPAADSAPGISTAASTPAVAPGAQGAPTAQAPQGLVHIVPFGRGSLKNTFAPANSHLTYWGGPVISQIHVVAVFWGPNVDAGVTGGIGQFFTDITSSRFYDLLTEYSTTGTIGSGVPAVSSNQAIVRGVFDTAVTITPALCPGPTACVLNDVQIQTELAAQITANHVPQPVSDATGNVETFYMIYFPPGVTISVNPTTKSCQAGGFCAYHSSLTTNVPYGVLPDFGPTSGCISPHCGSGTTFQNVTAVTSHEMSEAVTDVLVSSATDFAAPLAWYDSTPGHAEIGDICNGQDALVTAGANSYMIQTQFSNVQNDCVGAPPIFSLTAPAGGVAPGVSFNLPVTIQNSGGQFTLAGYTGTIHFTSSDATAVLPADFTFTATDAGTHTFPVTLSTLGDQTITVTDTHSAGFVGTGTINVNKTPDLVVSKTHTGNFVAGQTGSYTITVSNVGNGPTIGTVTVADALPTGLTASAISGPGWTCSLGTSCSRADVLTRTSSYPAINLVVNVIGPAPTRITNTVTVSGGGETNTANNSSADLTTISGPDLIVDMGAAIFFQGEVGAQYFLVSGNNGDLPTVGTVTIQDTISAGLTPTAVSGVGWNCTLAPLTCTRSDSWPAFTSFPPILVTADVALNAPATVTNLITVSGGGESNTANDTVQNVATVGPPRVPDIAVAVSHANNFVQGQTGVYAVQVSNAGLGASSGTITVTTSLPPSLTAAALAGPGWTCTVATVTCTRSDVLGGGIFYSTINLMVNVAANAPASVITTATVTGGGDTNLANNTATDTTIINPAGTPDLAIVKSHTGTFTQGLAGSYSITVSNVGSGLTNGPVTVLDTLPAGLTGSAVSGTGWTCSAATATPLSCTRSDGLAAGAAYPAITVAVNIAFNAPATVTNTATVSGGGETNSANDTANDPTTIAPGLINLTTRLFAGPGVSVGDTSDLFVFGVVNNGSSPSVGTVTVTDVASTGLTIISIGGTGWTCTLSPATCTRSDSVAPLSSFPDLNIRVAVALNAPSRVTQTLTVAGGGDSVPADNTIPWDTSVFGPVTINIFPATSTVTAGQPATIPLSVGLAQAAGSATFSCTGLPAAAACVFNPQSVTLSSSSAVSLTITTTARGAVAPLGFRAPPAVPVAVLMVFAFLGILALAHQGRRTTFGKLRPELGAALGCALILVMVAACGGGNNSVVTPTPTPVSGTPAGSYVVNVTGTTPIGAASTPYTLIVR